MEEEKAIGFSLQGIKTEKFAILAENYNQKKDVDLGTEIQFKLDHSSKQIGVYFNVEFLQSKKTFLKIEVSCHFKIQDDSWFKFTQLEVTKLVIPKNFLTHLAILTVGTTRGVLFAKTENTTFAMYMIPTLNLSDMIIEDVTFDSAKN